MLLKTRTIFLTLSLMVFACLVGGTAMAQEPAGFNRPTVQNGATAKGLSLIEEITVEARALRLPENRAIVQAAAAELLWAYDEKSARTLFREALSNLGSITNSVAQDDPEFTDLEQIAGELRREVLLKVARHDSLWASELMRAASRSAGQGGDELQRDLSSVAQTTMPARQTMQAAVETRKQGSAASTGNKRIEDANATTTGAPPEIRDGFDPEPEVRAQSADEFEHARQLASRITDPSERSEALANINRRYLLGAARAGRVEETINSLALLRTPEERASMLVELAMVMSRGNEKERARGLLNQARTLLGNRPRNLAQINAQLRVARVFATLDPDQAFEMIALVVYQLDELAAATAVVDGFITEEPYTRDDELMLEAVRRFLDAFSDGSEEDNGLASLACVEFDRMKNATDKFQHAELRVLAHLSLAESVLNQPTASLQP